LPRHAYLKNSEGVYLTCNILQVKSMGCLAVEEVIGKTDFDFIPAKQAKKIQENDAYVLLHGKPICVEESVTLPNTQEETIFLSQKLPLYEPNSRRTLMGLLGVSLDITQW